MYGTEDTGNVKNALLINSPIFDLSKFNKNDVYAKNTSDTSPDNVSFAILNRANGNSIDIFVVIEGLFGTNGRETLKLQAINMILLLQRMIISTKRKIR